MRIALVTRVYPTQRAGGMPHVCRDRAVALAKLGHDVHVITTSRSERAGEVVAESSERIEGVTVHHCSGPAHEWSAYFAKRCESLVAELAPDVLHLESFDRRNLWWRGHPTFITMHGVAFGTWATQWNGYRALGWGKPELPVEEIAVEATGLALAKRVFAVSRWEQRVIRDQYGVRDVSLIYNPIHEAFFAEPRRAQERTYFLAASISGAGPRGFEIARQAASRAGVEMRVVHGLPRTEMPAIYDGARALVLPTIYAQGYDLTVAEARSRGCPAIASPTGSYLDEAREWDEHVEIGDADGWERALREHQPRRVARSSAYAHEPSEHARAWLREVTRS